MACMDLAVDTSGYSEDEVANILDHLFQHHEKHVMSWIKEMVDDYVCIDCAGRERRQE